MQLDRKLDVPLERLQWTYPAFGTNCYSAKTEQLIVVFMINSIVNNRILSTNDAIRAANNDVLDHAGAVEEITASHVEGGHWLSRATIQLNRALTWDWLLHPSDPLIGTNQILSHYVFWNETTVHGFITT